MKVFPIKKYKTNKNNYEACDFYMLVLGLYRFFSNFSVNKYGRFFARNRARQRKEVLQNVTETISDKQLNLENLVAEYEYEESIRKQANKSASLYDVATWLLVLKNREDFQNRLKFAQEEQQNKEIAERYFDALKRKNITDAQFLREKTFSEQRVQQIQNEIDLQEIYEETKNMRRVVDAYNIQKRK